VGIASLFLCPIAALIVVGLAGRQPFLEWIQTVWARARQIRVVDLASARDLVRLFVATSIWLLLSAFVGWRLCLYCMGHIATAQVIAAASSVSVIAFGVAAALLAPAWLRIGAACSLIVPASWNLRRGVIALTVALALLLGGTAALAFKKIVYLPWRQIAVLVLIAVWLALFGCTKRLLKRFSLKMPSWVFPATALVLVGSGVLVAFRLGPQDTQVRARVGQNSAFLPLVYSLQKWATDFDSDGYLGWWGENDCAPWDPRIHPFADDPVGDGIDQDCDGADGSLAGVDPGPGRADYSVRDAPVGCPLFLITLDAISAKELQLYGGSSMPLLSRRAQKGVVFDWAFSQGPSTRLSIPSMLTSRYDTQITTPIIRGQPAEIDSQNEMLGEVLAREKYYTAAVAPVEYLATRLKGIYQGFRFVDRTPAAGEFRPGEHTADLVTEAAKRIVNRYALKDRFFLWVHYFDAHEPYLVETGDKPPVPTEYGRYQYELGYMDRYLDQLLSFIESRYSGRPHVVIVSADHGEAFDKKSHGVLHHGYDLSTAVTRVPLVVWGVGRPRRETKLVGLIDIMPTLVNLAKGRSARPEGNSLLPLLTGQQAPPRPLLGQFFLSELRIEGQESLRMVSVRLPPYVLYYTLSTQEVRLYNYEKDPLEDKDLSKQQPEMLAKLKVTVGSWLRRVYPELYHF
jgi:arylsulfatase A-like enzyme